MRKITIHHKQHFKQPKVLYLSAITSMCERFGYYIIGFLLTLYVKNIYNFSDEKAFATFALFTALGYLTPAIGGYIADHLIGIRRCLGLGLLFEAAGYFLLAIPSPNLTLFKIALAAIIVGAGIFKTAPTNIMGRAYEKNDPRIDSGFTLYYMGINIGSLSSAFISGSIKDAYGWHAPFLFAGAGLILGFIWFLFFKHHAKDHESKAGQKHYSLFKWILTIIGCFAVIAFIAYLIGDMKTAQIGFFIGSGLVCLYLLYELVVSPKDEKVKILVCLILIFMAVVFFLLYFQLYTSMELFIDRNVDRFFRGRDIPTMYYLGLNGLWIIILSPIFASFYKTLRKRGKGISITTKFPMGILLIGTCFLSLYIACNHFADSAGKISSWWMVLALFLYSSGELLISALGVAMITKIAPARMYGVMMGAWYLIATALAAELSGILAKSASIPVKLQKNVHATLEIYGGAFFKMFLIGLTAAVIGFAISPLLKRAVKLD